VKKRATAILLIVFVCLLAFLGRMVASLGRTPELIQAPVDLNYVAAIKNLPAATPLKPGEKLYAYDQFGMVTGVGDGIHDWMSGAVVFNSTGDDKIACIDFYATSDALEYVVRVWQASWIHNNYYFDYYNYNNYYYGPSYYYNNYYANIYGWEMYCSQLLAKVSGTVSQKGQVTVKLPNPAPVAAGQPFVVQVYFRTPGYLYPVPVEVEVPGVVEPTYGESYFGWDNDDSLFRGNLLPQKNICIRARTQAQGIMAPASLLLLN